MRIFVRGILLYRSGFRILNTSKTAQVFRLLGTCCNVKMSEITTEQRPKPVWLMPSPAESVPQLKLLNSLSKQKDIFLPLNGKQVSWYICGPTVYDHAHMGHARAYVAFDIIRRVMESYFGFDIMYVMNVTDVDDKIIKRARITHLLDLYFKNLPENQQIIEDLTKAIENFEPKVMTELDDGKLNLLKTQIEASKGALKHFVELAVGDSGNSREVLVQSKEVLGEYIDKLKGSTITDHSVFDALAKQFEASFHSDMKLLNVRPPNVLTRVSDYVPEIVKFTEKVIENGYAYATDDGSVYFDTQKFSNSPKHYYAKLDPNAFGVNVSSAMKESEGELSIGNERLKFKRNETDFALWKASKAGEPSWKSPWGNGRPGWHIECSVMASEICGKQLDIHAGGFDLKFPHHDNEIAQTEAFYESEQWVNYFLHAGTLRISGLKMSKSLKNFVSIRQACEKYTARQIRLFFLLTRWNDVMDYSVISMERAVACERLFNEFFLLVKHFVRTSFKPERTESYRKFEERELELQSKFNDARQRIHVALCDSIDTATVMDVLRELVALGNAYVNGCESTKLVPNILLLRDIAQYITNLMTVFGVNVGKQPLGFDAQSGSDETADLEEQLLPYLEAMSQFRETVRQIGLTEKSNALLEACDFLRDTTLADLGVRLEDKDGHTVVKIVGKEAMQKEREQRELLENEKKAEVTRKKAEVEAKEAAKRIAPEDLFKDQTDKYSKFDAKGIPTHDATGAEIGKKQRKKLEKLFETQQKKYQQSMAANGNA